MSESTEIPEGSTDPIKIGTIGTIGSLMSQELDSMKELQSSSSFRKKATTPPLSTPRTLPSENPSPELSRGDNHNARHLRDAEKLKQKPPRNGQLAPILHDEARANGKARRSTPNKKGRACLVEVVDIKCNNPVTGRLKKLGFSKLSETIG